MRSTEQDSLHDHLESKSTTELLLGINSEDAKVASAVEKCIPAISNFVEALYERMKNGGRLFYLGAGTSGRLGVVDASECPPTFGVDHGRVVGLIAGGDKAIRRAVENAEDDAVQGWKDLEVYEATSMDTIIGIAASGRTPYAIGAVRAARSLGCLTACITCVKESELGSEVEHPIEVEVGPEYVTGSTRMKSGTAQKLVLNMITTAVMIHLGHVKGNKMVDMQLSNEKLVDRGTKMVADQLSISYEEANSLLLTHGSVRKAVDSRL